MASQTQGKTKRGGIGETRVDLDQYSMSPKSIKQMPHLPMDWINWLEAMTPTYDSVLNRAGSPNIESLARVQGQKYAINLLNQAYAIQNKR